MKMQKIRRNAVFETLSRLSNLTQATSNVLIATNAELRP